MISGIENIRIKSEAAKIYRVVTSPRYLFLAAIASVLAFMVYALLLNRNILLTYVLEGNFLLAGRLVPLLVGGFIESTTFLSLVLLSVTSVLIGVNISLVVFRLVEQAAIGAESASSFGGMAVAVVAPACPACATALFASAGLTSVFALLPFGGAEVKVLAVVLLAGSAVWISTQIDKTVCEFC